MLDFHAFLGWTDFVLACNTVTTLISSQKENWLGASYEQNLRTTEKSQLNKQDGYTLGNTILGGGWMTEIRLEILNHVVLPVEKNHEKGDQNGTSNHL